MAFVLTVGPWGKELDMVTPIDAVHSGMGFDQAGRWHEARVAYRSAEQSNSDDAPGSPMRGIFYGLLFSAVLWIALIAAARAIFSLI
jgi:hypothetical protein